MINIVPDTPRTDWRWYLNLVSVILMSAFFITVFSIGMWTSATEDRDLESAAFFGAWVVLFLVTPFMGIYLKNRPGEIVCPQYIQIDGQSAIRFPGDRRGMHVSAVGWPVLALLPAAMFVPGIINDFEPSALVLLTPVLFLVSYTVFAVSGRFNEEGTTLTQQGVTIRARGLRADIPWSSIAGSTTVKHFPFPYERIAIHLHPGSPREVSVTVPWWIGSPRPRRDTVFLTKVQVPGFYEYEPYTNPGIRINEYLNGHTRLTMW